MKTHWQRTQNLSKTRPSMSHVSGDHVGLNVRSAYCWCTLYTPKWINMAVWQENWPTWFVCNMYYTILYIHIYIYTSHQTTYYIYIYIAYDTLNTVYYISLGCILYISYIIIIWSTVHIIHDICNLFLSYSIHHIAYCMWMYMVYHKFHTMDFISYILCNNIYICIYIYI